MSTYGLPDDEGSCVLHVDMDAFFASVEVRAAPRLLGCPVIVGGGVRGVVLSATYEARRYGVRSAMPMAQARRLCPAAVVVPANHDAYRAASTAVMEIFHDVTPMVQPLSLDEAFLDVTGARRHFGPPARVAAAIRTRVASEQGLTCSVGVAPSMFIAKIASARCKPDGLLVVPDHGVLAFLHPLPTTALWGVGERTEATLRRLGLRTIGDIADTPLATLRAVLGRAVGAQLSALAHGRDDRVVSPPAVDRSIGAEVTFPVDTADRAGIVRELLRLSERIGARLRGRSYGARTISLKVRYADFSTVTRARTLPEATDVAQAIYRTACELFDGLRAEAIAARPVAVRLVGVRVENLVAAGDLTHQLVLGERRFGRRDAEHAADRARSRFGADTIRPASLMTSPGVTRDGLPGVTRDGQGED
ncbi:DNA polymerase IV [Frankia sp. Cr1]|uniref:DNA polymerase IV n=1 Tax=Frankia sp. Cr1 TaxID=3073931 RepID=UPI002AD57C68|nr:DNA polymerase IV [Frankia sp. Cr1]